MLLQVMGPNNTRCFQNILSSWMHFSFSPMEICRHRNSSFEVYVKMDVRVFMEVNSFFKYSIFLFVYLSHYRPAMPFRNKKNILEDLFSSVLSQFKKYCPSRNLKYNHLSSFQNLKLRILMEKTPSSFS